MTFLAAGLLDLKASEETGFYVVHLKGEVTMIPEKAKSPENLEFSQVIKKGDSLFMDKGAELKLAHLNNIELWFAASASLTWVESKSTLDGFHLEAGALQVETEGGTDHPLEVSVPSAKVRSQMALFRIHRQRDGSSILDLEKGSVIVIHESKEPQLKSPIKVLINESGIHPMEEGKFKSRAIFDFREENTLTLEEISNQSKKREEEKAKSKSDQSLTVKGKASDAKLVEGDGDGEGEYRWDFSVNPWIIIFPLACIIGFVIYIRRSQNSEGKETNTSAGSSSSSQDDYESQDVYVWRGNLTSNDPPLKTTKTTHILGDVEDGVRVEAHHDLVIKGSVQGAEVIATKNLTVETGINGQDKALLMIGGELKASYISEAKGLVLGDVTIQQAMHGCTLAVQGRVDVEKKNIVGGWISALKGIRCQTLGSDFAETEIVLGMPATKAWSEKTGEDLAWEGVELKGPVKDDAKSSLEVMEEWVSAVVVHGEAKLEQKDPMPGPVRTRIDPTDRTRIQVQGFRAEDDESSETSEKSS